MDSLLILAIALAIFAALANLAVSFGVDSRDGFGWSGPAGLS
jgi:hypothetical protein